MENQAIYELLEQYLKGELNGSSLLEVENRLKRDADFATEFEAVRALHGLVELEGDRLALEMIHQASNEYESQKIVMRRRYIGFAIAAAIALIFLIVFPWNGSRKHVNDELFAENFSPYRAPSMSRSNGLLGNWEMVKNAYESKDYEAVIQALETDHLSNEDYLTQFYIGMSYLAKKPSEPNKAISSFQNVLKTDNDYHQAAEWYWGLALLKQNKIVAAKQHFDRLIKQGNSYQKDEILRLLENL